MVNLKLDYKYFRDRGEYKIVHLAAIGGYIDILKTVLKNAKMEIEEKTEADVLFDTDNCKRYTQSGWYYL